MPIGSALFIIVDPSKDTMDKTYSKLAECFPRAGGLTVNMGLGEWIDAGLPELAGGFSIRSPTEPSR